MLDLIDEFDRRTHANEGSLASVQLADEGTIAQSVLNNNRVLLADLKALFSQKRAEYLPGVITRNLRERFAHLAEAYNNLEQTSEPNHARRILGQMDELYAYCLQYGLITFGFRGKERSQIVQNLRNKVNATEAELATLDDQIRAAHESVGEQLVQIKEALGNAHSQAGQDISKKAEELMTALYRSVARINRPIMVTDIKSSEIIKYAGNAMLATRISFMNQLSHL